MFWNVLGKKNAVLVEYEGTGVEHEPEMEGGEKRREIKFVSTAPKERSVGETILDCDCFCCGGKRLEEDPISAIQSCGVEEVRNALVLEGFDLNGFDATT